MYYAGRRPFKLLPTDDEFSAALVDSAKDSFTRTLPKCVLEDLNNKEESRILFLWSGIVTGYDEYLTKYRKKGVDRNNTGTSAALAHRKQIYCTTCICLILVQKILVEHILFLLYYKSTVTYASPGDILSKNFVQKYM